MTNLPKFTTGPWKYVPCFLSQEPRKPLSSLLIACSAARYSAGALSAEQEWKTNGRWDFPCVPSIWRLSSRLRDPSYLIVSNDAHEQAMSWKTNILSARYTNLIFCTAWHRISKRTLRPFPSDRHPPNTFFARGCQNTSFADLSHAQEALFII